MKKIMLGLTLLFLCSFSGTNDIKFVDKALDYCAKQTKRSLIELKGDSVIDYTMMPRTVLNGNNTWACRKATKEEWTSGFWPGVLWYDFEYTQDPKIKLEAEKFTQSLEFLAHTPAYDHDLGFLVFCSYGNGYRLTGNPAYKQVLLNTADKLATLYNPKVGTILSWPHQIKFNDWPHNTIIDNMMNLELLFWAAKNGGDKKLYDIAVSHADNTMKNQFKPDYSCFQVALYDTLTGNFLKGMTLQGYSSKSMWARGQGWAIYGFTVCYRETHDKKYLEFAQNVADAYLKRLPEDLVPYWDFNAPEIPNAPRDASSACIVASALLEMSTYLNGAVGRKNKEDAVKMLKTLCSKIYESGKSNPSYMLHSTDNWPNNSEIDASIIYADYYFIEALLRLKKLNGGEKLFVD